MNFLHNYQDRLRYVDLPDDVKKYIDPTRRAMDDGIVPKMGVYFQGDVAWGIPKATFDYAPRDVQDNWIQMAKNKYAYDVATGKIKNPAQLAQQLPQQTKAVFAPQKPPMTRMQSAISRAASSGRMGNNNLNLKMGQPIFNGQTGLMKNSGGSQLLYQMGFSSNQAGVPTQGARRPVPMPQRRKPNINAGLV